MTETNQNETAEQNDDSQIEIVLARLARSAFRRRFRLGRAESAYLQTKGLETVLAHGRKFIEVRLAPAAPKNDGRQTPMCGHPVFVAQHATATCCRSCLAKWHHIERGRPLDASEVAYVGRVIEHWLTRQMRKTAAGANGQCTLLFQPLGGPKSHRGAAG